MAQKMLGPRVPAGASPHLWLPARGDEVDLPRMARAASIECAAADVFAVGPGASDAIRLSLSAAPGLVALQHGLKALASELALRRQPNEPTAALSLSSISRQDVSNE